MGRFRYFFEIDRNGNPLEGSNIRTQRPPRSASKRWKEIYTTAQACCDTDLGLDPTLEKSVGRSRRYYVRLDENQFPVSGSLVRRTHAPSAFSWQEVVGSYCCPITIGDLASATSDITDGLSYNFINEVAVVSEKTNCVKVKSIDGQPWEFGADYVVGDLTITAQSAFSELNPYGVVFSFDDSADVSETVDVVFTDCGGRNPVTVTFTLTFEAP
jgi:hypothetical protein